MDRARVQVDIATSPKRAWDLWLDAPRFGQWQAGLEAVTEASGKLDVPGTRYTMRAGPKMEMHAEVLAVEPGIRHVQRHRGMRADQVIEARFEPVGDGTRLTVEVEQSLSLGIATRLVERLGHGQSVSHARKELERFAEFAARPEVPAATGTWYALDDAGGHVRLAQVIAADAETVHLQLRAGTFKDRPASLSARPTDVPVLRDATALRPLAVSVRSAGSLVQQGQRLLLLDGGLGVDHLPLSPGAFSDARPQAIETGEVEPRAGDLIEGWLSAGRPVLGRDLGLRLTPIVSLLNGDGTFGVAKLLATTWREVHLRMYAYQSPTRPTTVNPWTLDLGRVDVDRLHDPGYELPTAIGVGHLPLSRAAYAKADPVILGLATLTPAELDGYRVWKEAGGGVFG